MASATVTLLAWRFFTQFNVGALESGLRKGFREHRRRKWLGGKVYPVIENNKKAAPAACIAVKCGSLLVTLRRSRAFFSQQVGPSP
jgi:hypothetical protein